MNVDPMVAQEHFGKTVHLDHGAASHVDSRVSYLPLTVDHSSCRPGRVTGRAVNKQLCLIPELKVAKHVEISEDDGCELDEAGEPSARSRFAEVCGWLAMTLEALDYRQFHLHKCIFDSSESGLERYAFQLIDKRRRTP